MAKEMIAMLLAGGQGSRLYALTQKLAKPAVPFGGKYRIIDFPLSNCVNSGIDTVGILTQYQPHGAQRVHRKRSAMGFGPSLRRSARPAALPEGIRHRTGTRELPMRFIKTFRFIERYNPEYVIILSGDQICKQDYSRFPEVP